MKTSMKTMLAALAVLLSAGLMAAEGWSTNFKKAKEEGRAKKLPVLMVFSGSMKIVRRGQQYSRF